MARVAASARSAKSTSSTTFVQGPIHTSGLALGGLGSAGVEIWPDGRLYQWMFPNALPWSNNGHANKAGPFDAPQPAAGDADFLVRVAIKGQRPVYRWLFAGNGYTLTTASHFWRHHKYFFIRSFQQTEYCAQYPFATLTFRDEAFPVEVRLKAWSAFVPHNVKDSSLPGCYFDIEVMSKTKQPAEVTILWQMQNVSGFACAKNAQEHKLHQQGDLTAVTMAGGLDEPKHFSAGDMTIWAQKRPGQKIDAIACNPYFQNLVWSLHQEGHLHAPLMPERLVHEEHVREPRHDAPNKGYLCIQQKLAPGKSAEASFGLAWFFPHHIVGEKGELGHRYAEWFGSSAEVATYMAKERKRLLVGSEVLPREVMASTIPGELKAAVLDQMATLVKNSHFGRDGRFGIQEGHGCCGFNTVDVDHYSSFALSLLQPELRQVINEMNRSVAHPKNGKMIHSHEPSIFAKEPGGGPENRGYNRWDVCCQYALAVWRDCAWSGDIEGLMRHYPTVLRTVQLVASLDFYGIGLPYIQGGITYDHWNMQGVVGYLAGIYLASLRAVEEMAKLVRDAASAEWAAERLARGQKAFEQYLYNGKQYLLYYGRRPQGWKPGDDAKGEHKLFEPVRPPEECCATACDCAGGNCCDRPKSYIEIGDTGLMTDLLNGDGTAAVAGLGSILDRKRVRAYLKQVFDRNVQPENMCVVNGSYPDDHFLDEWPFMQWQTPWTGTEYFYALMCYTAGMVKEGDAVIRMVHDRHLADGMRFDHAECNNHYARPLSIWGAWAARIGLRLNALDGVLGIVTPDGRPYAGLLLTGTMVGRCEYVPGKSLSVTAVQGQQMIRTLEIGGAARAGKATVQLGGRTLPAETGVADGVVHVQLNRPVTLKAGQTISVVLR